MFSGDKEMKGLGGFRVVKKHLIYRIGTVFVFFY